MRRLALALLVAGGLAYAGGKVTAVSQTTSAPWGVPPTTLQQGLDLANIDYVQASVHGLDSVFDGGAICWFRNPNIAGTASPFDGDAGWEVIGNARQVASWTWLPDAGPIRRYTFPALKVGLPYGRIMAVGCPLTGLADDGGVERFIIKTEGWQKP